MVLVVVVILVVLIVVAFVVVVAQGSHLEAAMLSGAPGPCFLGS